MEKQKYRAVTGIINGRQSTVGTWLKKCVVPSWALDRVSPFIVLEQIGPMLIEPGIEDKILPRPRRGYEAVTLLFSGALQHTDSLGNNNLLLAGDVLWLTAGKGIIHSEYRPEEFSKTGGIYHALQFWVNLPKTDKMVQSKCQDIKAAFIPICESADNNVTIRVISGSLQGTTGPIKTHTPIQTLHAMIREGCQTTVSIPESYNALAYIASGRVLFNDEHVLSTGQLALFEKAGQLVQVGAEEEASIVFLAGESIDEPVTRPDLFIMNSESEIVDTLRDYRKEKLGSMAVVGA